MSTISPPRAEGSRVHEQLSSHKHRGEFAVQWREAERTLPDFLGALWAKRWGVIAFTVLTTGVGLIYAVSKPNAYVSEATLMVTGSNATNSIAEATRSYLSGMVTGFHEVLNASKIVGSREVARRTVSRIGATEVLRPYVPIRDETSAFGGLLDHAHRLLSGFGPRSLDKRLDALPSFQAAATEAVSLGLWALPEDQSTALKVRYRATHPEVAQRVLQALAEEAIAQWQDVMAPKESRTFLQERLKAAVDEEGTARRSLNDFLAKHGATDYSEELSQLSTGLARVSNELEVWRATLESDRREVEELEKELAKTPEMKVLSESESLRQMSAIEGLRTEIAKAENARNLAKLDGTPTKRLEETIRNMQASIADLEGKGSDKIPLTQRGPNPTWVTLQAKLTEKRTEIIGLSVRLPTEEAYLKRGRTRLEDLRKLQSDADALQSKVKAASESVHRIQDALRSFDVNEDLTARGITSLRLVEPANLPLTKEGPQRGRVILGALLGGLFCALSVVIARVRLSKALLRGEHARHALLRADVVAAPWLEAKHVQRFIEARRRGWV